MYKILITGSRNFTNTDLIKKTFDTIQNDFKINVNESFFIHGNCKGADKLGALEAFERNYKVVTMEPEWQKFGKSAAIIRNTDMIKLLPDIIIIFSDDLSNSKGTLHCVKYALKSLNDTFEPIFYLNGILISIQELKKY